MVQKTYRLLTEYLDSLLGKDGGELLEPTSLPQVLQKLRILLEMREGFWCCGEPNADTVMLT